MRGLVDLKRTTGNIEDNVLFCFTLKSGSVPNIRPPPTSTAFFSLCLPPRLKHNTNRIKIGSMLLMASTNSKILPGRGPEKAFNG